MPPDALQQTAAGILALAAFASSSRRIARDGGRVATDDFRMPDALVAGLLALFFAATALVQYFDHAKRPAPVTVEQVLPGSLVYLILVLGVAGFLKYRSVKLAPLFGLDRLPPIRVAGWILGLGLAAIVLSNDAASATLEFLRLSPEQQPLLLLFRDVALHGDRGAMAKIFVAGAILAPVCEEFLFRGFFYGVGKRYLGSLASGFVTALLFAAVHQSPSAFAGLFVLAVCLTIAYERTGSLLVPVGIHAFFNFTSLCFAYFLARRDMIPSQ